MAQWSGLNRAHALLFASSFPLVPENVISGRAHEVRGAFIAITKAVIDKAVRPLKWVYGRGPGNLSWPTVPTSR